MGTSCGNACGRAGSGVRVLEGEWTGEGRVRRFDLLVECVVRQRWRQRPSRDQDQ